MDYEQPLDAWPETLAPARLIGEPGRDLTGAECRVLRAALNLDRPHVVALCNALAIAEATQTQVTQWERSSGRGYPPALVDALSALERAVGGLSRRMAYLTPPDPVATVLRPPADLSPAALDVAAHGLALDPARLPVLDQAGGDFWTRLVDAAAVRASLAMHRRGHAVRVTIGRTPDEAIRPKGQSAPPGQYPEGAGEDIGRPPGFCETA